MRKKNETKYGNAVLIGLGVALLLILFTPRCQKVDSVQEADIGGNYNDPELNFVLDSLRRSGFSVVNHYPVYVRVVKRNVGGDTEGTAMAIAKSLKDHTGKSVKVQLDAEGGTTLADPDKGFIDPSQLIELTE